MPRLEVREMTADDEYFVGTCSHVNESPEADAASRLRLACLARSRAAGGATLVALLDGRHAGFLHATPIELSSWGPVGRDLMVVPCLFVPQWAGKRGAGRALVAEAEALARASGRRGVVTLAYHHDFWFMPAAFFERLGYVEADRQGEWSALWKPFSADAQAPRLPRRRYEFRPVAGKVVVDLFWNGYCQTSAIEAARVREVAAEFGDAVLLVEHCADDPDVLAEFGTARGIFVNGREIGWGYEAPKEGVRAALSEALAAR